MTPQPPQPAYILHTRPFRDSSLLLDLLTPEWGRIACVARGARRSKQRRQRALQPFTPLLVSLLGRGELKNLGAVESAGAALRLQGRAVYAGFYANELLVRLLPAGETHYRAFAGYQTLLQSLAQLDGGSAAPLEAPLRRFELQLLSELGSCPPLNHCTHSGGEVDAAGLYRLENETGLVPVVQSAARRLPAGVFTGADLLAMDLLMRGGASGCELPASARQLTRLLLTPLLGEKPLRSRELFRQVYHDH
ncbi:DNA repair protein RecO [Microbulbifer discodermiae]|uniref:DNA repair protein RecO n=1 Tax=Microbulbifer sp. 2201CG32-9 TaxID=3232309 RepID=UPI00345B817F